MVSGQQAAGSEGARAVEEAARLPGDGSEEERPPGLGHHRAHRPRTEICFSVCVTEGFSGSSGRRSSLALGEPALWGVTDGGSWHPRGRGYAEPPGGPGAGGPAGWSMAGVLESDRTGFKSRLHDGNSGE